MNITLKLISRKGPLRNTNSPNVPLRELKNNSESGFFYSFVIGKISRSFEYFLITNHVISVIKIFRQILEGSPDSVSYFIFLRIGLQRDSY
jgi:hypothetical protein